ncbi:malonate decarboxylase holo-[acyl-carrier-protein] synthase [Klebsiella pneumoniae]|nr:malonate decarboxylase holo-[acyl-carrier-protein] synthase [Klebsiella pneumoniae]
MRRGIRDEASISLGFCFPQRWQGQRLRLATVASLQAVTRVSTPEQTAILPAVNRTSAIRAFSALRQAWRGPETGLGVWGSVALEMTTPWLWTDSRSDLDIRITPWHEMALSDCYSVLTDIAQQYSVRIDGEINLPNGFSINIKEWFSRSLTLLAKGETDVELMTRQDVDGLIKHLSMIYIKGN